MRGIVFGCFAGSVPKSSFGDLGTTREPKESQKGAKGIQKEAKVSQKGAKRKPKGAKREPKWSQRATKMHIKIDLRKRFRKVSILMDSRDTFWEPFC